MPRQPWIRLASLLAIALAGACTGGRAPDLTGAAVAHDIHFVVSAGADGGYHFDFNAGNHQAMLSSDRYSERVGALAGAMSVLANGTRRDRYHLVDAQGGDYYFTLHGRNGQILATSALYSSYASASRAIDVTMADVSAYRLVREARTGARFDVFQGDDGHYYFNLYARNGQIVLRSQPYVSQASALNGAFSVSENGLDPDHYDLRDAARGGVYFTLKARNGRVIGTSQIYATRADAARGRDAVVALLPDVDIL